MKRFSVTSEKVIKRCFTYYDNISTRRNLWWNNRTDLSHQRFWCPEAILSSKMQIKDVIHVKVKIYKVQPGSFRKKMNLDFFRAPLLVNFHTSGWSLWRLKPVKSILLETVLLNRVHIFRYYPQFHFYTFYRYQDVWKKSKNLEKKFYTKDDNHFSHTRNHPSKMNLFWCYEFFSELSISKKNVKMNLRIITINMQLIQEKDFPHNRFQSPLESQVSSDSLGGKIVEAFSGFELMAWRSQNNLFFNYSGPLIL